jgi:hypothetical protein
MAKALRKFVTEFTKRDNNFLEAVIIENSALPISFHDKMPLKIEDIDDAIMRDPEDKNKIETLKIKDLMSADGFLTKYEFVRGLNSGLSQILWGKLDKI